MNYFCPAHSQILLHGAAGEIEQLLIDVANARVRTGYPNHHRRRIGHVTKAGFAFLQSVLRFHPFGNIARGHQQALLAGNLQLLSRRE